MKITEYTIVTSTCASDLKDAVIRMIELGWQPFGGVSRNDGLYMHAMVKYANES